MTIPLDEWSSSANTVHDLRLAVQEAIACPPGGIHHDGRLRLAAVQPHADDAALSAGGILSSVPLKSVRLVTSHGPLEAQRRLVRNTEDKRFAKFVSATAESLNLNECADRFGQSANHANSRAAQELEDVIATLDCDLLLVPAGIGQHPDHLAVCRAGGLRGAVAFWEDVAYWGIYGLSIDDRVSYTADASPVLDLSSMTMVAFDISHAMREKVYGLSCYSSQSEDVWRPIRYAATAAAEIGAPFTFCERLFVRTDEVDAVVKLLGGSFIPGGSMRYGLANIDCGWAIAHDA